jgi:glycerol-3-phosphate dehydrogenase
MKYISILLPSLLQGHVLVGTTDKPCKNISMRPEPEEDQILWLLKECSKYLNPELKVRREVSS